MKTTLMAAVAAIAAMGMGGAASAQDWQGFYVGASLGYVLSQVLTKYRLIRVPADVYQMSYVPFRVLPLDIIVVIIGAVLICFVATLYPSRQAARLDPVQALRYE